VQTYERSIGGRDFRKKKSRSPWGGREEVLGKRPKARRKWEKNTWPKRISGFDVGERKGLECEVHNGLKLRTKAAFGRKVAGGKNGNGSIPRRLLPWKKSGKIQRVPMRKGRGPEERQERVIWVHRRGEAKAIFVKGEQRKNQQKICTGPNVGKQRKRQSNPDTSLGQKTRGQVGFRARE